MNLFHSIKMKEVISLYRRIGIFIFIISFLVTCVIGCGIYDAPEQERKIDSKQGRKELEKPAFDMKQVEAQKRKNTTRTYKLEDGLESLKDLDIVKDATIKKKSINVNFYIKDMKNASKSDRSKKELLWENSLFLCYTIYDTFTEIEEIRLSADYYFMDQYGRPYKEVVFISNIKRNQLKLINRDYFQPEMLYGVMDFYMADYLTEKVTKTEKE